MSSVSTPSVDQRMSDDELLRNYQLSMQEFLPSAATTVPGALKAVSENSGAAADQCQLEEAASHNDDGESTCDDNDSAALVAELQKSMMDFMKDLEVPEGKKQNREIPAPAALTKTEKFAMRPTSPSYISKGVAPTAPVRRDDNEFPKRTGSDMHGTGDCSACGFFYKGKCSDGFDCKYCHLCTKADMRDKRDKARKKLKETKRQQE